MRLHYVIFFLALVFVRPLGADVPEYKNLLSCYEPGRVVLSLNLLKELCTENVWKLASQTNDGERLVAFAQIVYNADSISASKPFFERAISKAREYACATPTIAIAISNELKSGEADFLKKCRPFDPVQLSNLMLHLRDADERKRACQHLGPDLKKAKMEEVCVKGLGPEGR
jgi:hypothetical protein